jgi:osmotically-inducible protein OsmY
MMPFFFAPFPEEPGRPAAEAHPPSLGWDERIATLVTERLLTELVWAADRIVVQVQNRVVILQGVVRSETVRRRAHDIAGDTSGVFDVCDQLVVRSLRR